MLARRGKARRQAYSSGLPDAGWHPDQCQATVASLLRFPEAISPHDREDLLGKAFRQAGRHPNTQQLLDALKGEIKSFLRQKPRRLVVLTSISLPATAEFPRIRWLSRAIGFGRSYPVRFRKSAAEIAKRACENGVRTREASHLLKVWIQTDARSHWDAITNGSEGLDNVISGIYV